MPKCRLCDLTAYVHVTWGPGLPGYGSAQSADLCKDHALELWKMMSLPNKECVVIKEPQDV